MLYKHFMRQNKQRLVYIVTIDIRKRFEVVHIHKKQNDWAYHLFVGDDCLLKVPQIFSVYKPWRTSGDRACHFCGSCTGWLYTSIDMFSNKVRCWWFFYRSDLSNSSMSRWRIILPDGWAESHSLVSRWWWMGSAAGLDQTSRPWQKENHCRTVNTVQFNLTWNKWKNLLKSLPPWTRNYSIFLVGRKCSLYPTHIGISNDKVVIDFHRPLQISKTPLVVKSKSALYFLNQDGSWSRS